MPRVTIEDLTETQKTEQVPGYKKESAKTRILAETKKGQAYYPVLTVLMIAFVSQTLGIDLAHLVGAYLVVRGIPPLYLSLKNR